MKATPLLLLTLLLALPAHATGAATLRRIGKGAAAPRVETIAAETPFATRASERAELTLPHGAVVRCASGTQAAVRGAGRELLLEKGTVLVDVPHFRGGTRLRLGALTLVCGGATVLVEHRPGQSVKVAVLAGELRVTTGGFFGDSLVIAPGRMLIATPDTASLPDPVDVDLAHLARTSALLADANFPGAAPLTGATRLPREIDRQAKAVQTRALIPTNLAILGSGTQVVIPGDSNPAEVTTPTTERATTRIKGAKPTPRQPTLLADQGPSAEQQP